MKAFGCETLRSGWIVGWMIDGKKTEQRPQLRVEARTPMLLWADAESVVAIFGVQDDKPPNLLQFARPPEWVPVYYCPACVKVFALLEPCGHIDIEPRTLEVIRAAFKGGAT
jgi:hypothetical protein